MRKPYVRSISTTGWYFGNPRYMRYMAREVTCIFIGIYTILLVVLLMRLAEGQAAYDAYMQALTSPLSVLFHLVALGFSVYHSTQWFNVTPQAMPIQRGEEFLAGGVIVGAHYGGWAVVTIVVLLLAGVFS